MAKELDKVNGDYYCRLEFAFGMVHGEESPVDENSVYRCLEKGDFEEDELDYMKKRVFAEDFNYPDETDEVLKMVQEREDELCQQQAWTKPK